MKLIPRLCPNHCMWAARTKPMRVRMEVLSKYEPRGKREAQGDVVLFWFCKTCGHMEPVGTSDLRMASRYPVSATGNMKHSYTKG